MDRQQLNNQNEIELVRRLKEGDHDAFEMLYHVYKDRLIGNLLRILKSRALVEEQVQDVFLKVWKGRDKIDVEKPFKAYLFTIAANMAKNVIRSAYYDKQMRATLLPVDQRIYMHVEEQITADENKQVLHNLLEKLPPQRRTVFTLCKLEGKSYKEVSELLNISENTVNDHIRKANLTLSQLRTNKKMIGLLFALCLCAEL
ncbi:MAG TPA: RNA polymerase sigma-70 factor [Sphingobacterium sp.]|nr:RNA polymerase sigma-70 factor [Sphingobacterium sp.]